jgi:hypothetical protein
MQEIASEAYASFDTWFITVLRKSGGRITTSTAADIAAKLAVGLYGPLMEKLDPAVIGEHARMVESAVEYASILCPNLVHGHVVDKLVFGYPTHGFVIDREELTRLFDPVPKAPVVRRPNEAEERLVALLDKHCGAGIVRDPARGSANGLVHCLNPLDEAKPIGEQPQANAVEKECPPSDAVCGSGVNADHSEATPEGAISNEQDTSGNQAADADKNGQQTRNEAPN